MPPWRKGTLQTSTYLLSAMTAGGIEGKKCASLLKLLFAPESRDGGTGRRSGLKIRRPSGLGGSTPPPGTNVFNQLIEEGGAVEISSASDCNCFVTISLRSSNFRTASSRSRSLTMLYRS